MDDNGHFLSDAELVARTLAGDCESFGPLYDRYARLVRAVAFGVGRDLAATADLTQECFLRAFHRLSTLRVPERFGPWIVGIARQVAREHRRRRREQLLGDTVPALVSDPAAAAGAADEIEQLLRLVCRLPEPERLAVHFFYLNERNAAET